MCDNGGIMKSKAIKLMNEEIVKMYLAGCTLDECGNKYGMSRQAVQQKLVKLGIPRRRAKGERKHIQTSLKGIRTEIDKHLLASLFEDIKILRSKLKREQIRNAMAKKYYMKMMAKHKLESAELMEVLNGEV